MAVQSATLSQGCQTPRRDTALVPSASVDLVHSIPRGHGPRRLRLGRSDPAKRANRLGRNAIKMNTNQQESDGATRARSRMPSSRRRRGDCWASSASAAERGRAQRDRRSRAHLEPLRVPLVAHVSAAWRPRVGVEVGRLEHREWDEVLGRARGRLLEAAAAGREATAAAGPRG